MSLRYLPEHIQLAHSMYSDTVIKAFVLYIYDESSSSPESNFLKCALFQTWCTKLFSKDVNRSSVIAKHVHRWFPVTVASQALTGQTMGRYTLWVLGFIENRLGNALNANP